MQLIRASVWHSPIWLGEPNSNPLESIENYVLFLPQRFEISEQNGIETNKPIPFNILPFSPALWDQFPPQLLSITPMQFVVMNSNPNSQAKLQNIDTVLLGGTRLVPQKRHPILPAVKSNPEKPISTPQPAHPSTPTKTTNSWFAIPPHRINGLRYRTKLKFYQTLNFVGSAEQTL